MERHGYEREREPISYKLLGREMFEGRYGGTFVISVSEVENSSPPRKVVRIQKFGRRQQVLGINEADVDQFTKVLQRVWAAVQPKVEATSHKSSTSEVVAKSETATVKSTKTLSTVS